MDDKPLVINEPVATGWLRTELFGDKDKAAGYAYDARKLLGGMRSMYGVNDRIASGDGGGFYQRTIRLQDGTIIQAITNDGHDTLRINVPTIQPTAINLPGITFDNQEFATPVSEGTGFSWIGDGTSFTGTPTEFRSAQSGEEKITELELKNEEVNVAPYMWIGARIRWEDHPGLIGTPAHVAMPWYGLTVMVMEPGDNGLVISSGNFSWYSYVGGNEATETVDLAQAQSTFSSSFPDAPSTMHCFQFFNVNDSTSFLFTKNGLRLYDQLVGDPVSTVFSPFDPEIDPTKPLDRVFAADDGNYYSYGGARGAWDQVVVLDPQEGDGTAPEDDRVDTDWSRKLLERSGMKNQVLSGNYIVKIAAWGDPRRRTSRGDQHPPSTGAHYHSACDFREYLTEMNLPLRVEVEVRLGKQPFTTTQTFTIEVPDYDEDITRTLYPFGDSGYAPCPIFSGQNPHAANWWQGALLVDVEGGTVERQEYNAPSCFAPSTYNFDTLYRTRYPMDIYVSGLNGADNADIQASYATHLMTILEQMCTGYWGYGYEISLMTYDDIYAIAPSTATDVWLYNPVKKTFTAMPGISGDWFAFYRMDSLLKCRGSMWVDIDGGASGTGIYSMPGDPDMGTACCPDVFFGN